MTQLAPEGGKKTPWVFKTQTVHTWNRYLHGFYITLTHTKGQSGWDWTVGNSDGYTSHGHEDRSELAQKAAEHAVGLLHLELEKDK